MVLFLVFATVFVGAIMVADFRELTKKPEKQPVR